jgi:hypothetical protein
MKTFNPEKDIFVNEYSYVNAFCLSALTTVEKFILGCKARDLTPSYDNFTLWMEAHPNSIT